MSAAGKRRAGQPIIVFAVLLIGWVGLRATIWESPFPILIPTGLVELKSGSNPDSVITASGKLNIAPEQTTAAWPYEANGFIPPPKPVTVGTLPPDRIKQAISAPHQSDMFASHQLMWLAAMGRVPLPRDVAYLMQGATTSQVSTPIALGAQPERSAKRWSADSWLFLRPDAKLSAATGSRFASYGASQAGAVLRYRLSPGNTVRPTAYMRATKALAAGRETEVAAGLSARPVPAIPIAVYAELRATRGAVTTEVRPAAFVVTEFPPVQLPLGLRAEAYLAGGYVGGDFATPFVDGQTRVDREIVKFNLGSVRAGAGAWGGAQQGAARIDIGPSASLDMKVGSAPARISMDYRFRAVGDAQPGSGVAITLSTGF